MPKTRKTTENDTPDAPRTNPSVDPHTSTVNPSAPTVGTEAWGNTSDERKAMGNYQPAGTRAGQMKRNPGDNRAEATEPAERATDRHRAGHRDREQEHGGDSGSDQPDLSRRTSASAHSLNTNQPHARNAYRCADIAGVECGWETSDDSEDEVMRRIEEHWRTDHASMGDWTAAMRDRVRDNIHRRKAA